MKKDVRFGVEIDPKILRCWKETITKNETIKERLEESLLDNIKNHSKC